MVVVIRGAVLVVVVSRGAVLVVVVAGRGKVMNRCPVSLLDLSLLTIQSSIRWKTGKTF